MEDDDDSSSSIGPLKKVHIPVVSQWLFKEWYDCYLEWGISDLESATSALTNFKKEFSTKFMLIAVSRCGNPIGCITVDDVEMVSPPDFISKEYHWLTDVYVVDDFRGKGVGKKLVLAAEKKAKDNGIKKLQLVTEHHRDFYRKLGWVFDREFQYLEKKYSYMFRDL